LRLRVPEDDRLIGYDDSIVDMLTLPLAFLLQPYDKIANSVIEIDLGPRFRQVIATRFVLRQSVGSA
jgi:DNA-binding LacI/PurR family transcriptional regulator